MIITKNKRNYHQELNLYLWMMLLIFLTQKIAQMKQIMRRKVSIWNSNCLKIWRNHLWATSAMKMASLVKFMKTSTRKMMMKNMMNRVMSMSLIMKNHIIKSKYLLRISSHLSTQGKHSRKTTMRIKLTNIRISKLIICKFNQIMICS